MTIDRVPSGTLQASEAKPGTSPLWPSDRTRITDKNHPGAIRAGGGSTYGGSMPDALALALLGLMLGMELILQAVRESR